MPRIAAASIIAVLVLALGTIARSDTQHPHAPQKFTVGVGAPSSGRILRGATAPGGTLTVARASIILQADGSQIVSLIYTNATGAIVSQRTLLVDSGCTRVVDNLGTVVSASGPTAECSAATAFLTQVDTTINSAASGGKLNL